MTAGFLKEYWVEFQKAGMNGFTITIPGEDSKLFTLQNY